MKKKEIKKIKNNFSYWENVISQYWKINGKFLKLNSEFDLNFEVIDHKNNKFIVKIMRNDCDEGFLEGQIRFLKFINKTKSHLPIPKIFKSIKGNDFEKLNDENKNERYVWIIKKIEGELFSDFKPKPLELIYDLGKKVGLLDLYSKRFKKTLSIPSNKWNLSKPYWIKNHLSDIKNSKIRKVIEDILVDFKNISNVLLNLESHWTHNDLNDQNLLVNYNGLNLPEISGILDFGDLTFCPKICNIAICSAYLLILPDVGIEKQLHFLKGYHLKNPISENELDILYTLILVRIAVSYVNSIVMSKNKPDDPYVLISQNDTKNFLLSMRENKDFITARFRDSCGFSPLRSSNEVEEFLNSNLNNFFPAIKGSLKTAKVINLDPQNCSIPEDPFNITDGEALNLTNNNQQYNTDYFYLGKYLEPRLIYTSKNFFR